MSLVLDITCGGPGGSSVVVDRAERHAVDAQGGLEYVPAPEEGGYEFGFQIDAEAGDILEISGNAADFDVAYYSQRMTLEWRGILTSTTGDQPLVQKVFFAYPESDPTFESGWWFGVKDGVVCFAPIGVDYTFILLGVATVPVGEIVTLSLSRYGYHGSPVPIADYAFAINGVVDSGIHNEGGTLGNSGWDENPDALLRVGGHFIDYVYDPDLETEIPVEVYADTFYIDALRFYTDEFLFGTTDYEPSWPECTEGEVEWDASNEGFWRDQIRTLETVEEGGSPTYRIDQIHSWEAGSLDGAEWAVGKTEAEINAELAAMQAGDISTDARTMFLVGRFHVLAALNGIVPDGDDMNDISLMGYMFAATDSMALSITTPIFLPPIDALATRYNLTYRATWEGVAAGLFDIAQSNPEFTSVAYDESLNTSIFDTLDYDIYVQYFDAGYAAGWSGTP